MKKYLVLILSALLLSCSHRADNATQDENVEMNGEEVSEFGIRTTDFQIKEDLIKKGEFFNGIMMELGVKAADIYTLNQASKGIFDLRKLRIGNSYKAFFTTEGEPSLAYLIYEQSRTSYVIFCLKDSISVRLYEREVSTRTKVGEVKITASLWEDVARSGMNINIASRVEDIYAWSIDFFGLQKGDLFKVVYDEILIGNEVVDIGTIYSALFLHGGKQYEAYRFIDGDTSSIQYYNEKGENLKKAFLKAPLRFTRISSVFSYARKHPVTRIVRPHTGVDYAAPKGTKVMTIGDGVVVQRSYSGAGGNSVKIKHNATYTSAYLHLSGYAPGLKVGGRVRQGDIIGYVGSTGLATGPHLDFRIWKNGRPINPLKMESPPAKQVSKSNMEAFRTAIKEAHFLSDSLISMQYLDTLVRKLSIR
jgi:murein DD-endopeptidase MepM/ murein hydrolase activator NlpD